MPRTERLPLFYRVKEFCQYYRIGKTKTYAEIKSGRLQARKRGATRLIAVSDAEAWAAAQILAEPDGDGTH